MSRDFYTFPQDEELSGYRLELSEGPTFTADLYGPDGARVATEDYATDPLDDSGPATIAADLLATSDRKDYAS